MPITRLWQTADYTTRACLALALVAATVTIATYLGFPKDQPTAIFYLPHVVTIALGFLVFGRSAVDMFARIRGRARSKPRHDWLLTGAALLAAGHLLLAFGNAFRLGEGMAVEKGGRYYMERQGEVARELTAQEYVEFNAGFFRAFSSGWLFFALGLAAWNHNVLGRRRPSEAT